MENSLLLTNYLSIDRMLSWQIRAQPCVVKMYLVVDRSRICEKLSNAMTIAGSMSPKRPAKALEIMSIAQGLIQNKGYNGFSFRDVADAVGIKSASIHYHFPTKSHLVKEITSNYRAEFQLALDEIDALNLTGLEKLEHYAGLFAKTLQKKQCVCLAGILATEIGSLSEDVRVELDAFFTEQAKWLSRTIRDGQTEGNINPSIDAEAFAPAFVSGLEGAMIIARSKTSLEYLSSATSQYLDLIKT